MTVTWESIWHKIRIFELFLFLKNKKIHNDMVLLKKKKRFFYKLDLCLTPGHRVDPDRINHDLIGFGIAKPSQVYMIFPSYF
jgi:hypothetical protein